MRRSAAAVILAVACLAAACSSIGAASSRAGSESPDPRNLAETTNFPPATLYLARRRWHIDVGLAADALRPPLADITREFPGSRYVFFGFGDRRYLEAKNRDAPALLAALWPGAGLILVTVLSNSPQEAFGEAEVIELALTPAQSRAAQDFIWRSLSRSTADTLTPIAPGPYEGGAYFEAVPRYSGLHTCITWAAEALRAAGFPVRTRLTLVAGQLWRQALRLRASAAVALLPQGDSTSPSSIARRRVTVLANHGRAAALGDHDGGLGRWGRATAADAASQ
jgi:hypothetical protein